MTSKSTKEPPLPSELQTRLDALASQPWSADVDDAAEHLAQLLPAWKALGNACYGHGCFLAAIHCYTKLIALPGGDTAAARSNRSAAYLQSPLFAGPSLALKDAEKAVEMETTWFKAHLRVGDAQRRRGNIVEADAAYRRALALQPDCEGAKAGLRALADLQVQDDATPTSSLPASDGVSRQKDSRATEDAPLTQEQQLESWKRETIVREDRTGMRPRPVSLAEADRQSGVAIKQSLLAKFRAKVEADETLGNTLRERHEEEVLQGDGVDYREAEKYRRVYAHSTDGIGLGISADAYKEYTGQVDHRTW